MKKIYLFILIFCFALTNVKSQSKLETTLEEIFKAVVKISGSIKNISYQTIDVNSSSNAYLLGGKTRQVVKVDLPKGTEKWYYRITVLDIKSNYQY